MSEEQKKNSSNGVIQKGSPNSMVVQIVNKYSEYK